MRRLSVVLAICAAVLLAVLCGLFVLLAVGPAYPQRIVSWSSVPDVAMLVALVALGVLVTLKRPGNLVGWALLLSGFGQLLGGVGDAYAELALLQHPAWKLPLGRTVAAIQAGSWTALMAGVFLLLVVFPAGRLESRRVRRWTIAVLACFAWAWLGVAARPGHLGSPFESYRSPLAPTQDHAAFLVLAVPVIVFCLGSIAIAGIRLVIRFRRSRGLERQQFKWLAANAGLLIVSLPFAAADSYSSSLASLPFSIALVALPVSVGIAVLRYRLYEIDRIVSKTLVYGSLTVILGAGYAGLVLAGQAVFASFAGGSKLAIAVSTLVVAALFLPVRSRLQRFVDRRFYRRRYDAQRTLESFGLRLRQQVDLGVLSADLLGAVHDTMEPTHLTLWLRQGGAP